MKKIFFLLACLLGLGNSYAEEVEIQLVDDLYFRYVPGLYFLNGEARITHVEDGCVTVYDENLQSFTLAFDCERINPEIDMFDARYQAKVSADVPFTQSFFNDDAEYEAIAYDVLEDGSWANYRVVNQDGDVLYTFEKPDGFVREGEPVFVKISDEVIVAYIQFGHESYWDGVKCWYTLKVGQTGPAAIQQIQKEPFDGKVVNHGDRVVVTVGDEFPQSTLTVSALSGVVVKEVAVVDGKAVIATSDMTAGIYVASHASGQSTKFIVK